MSALSSIRDLLDSAGGIPNDAQAIATISNDLRQNLWLPAIEKYNDTITNLTAKEAELEQFAGRVNDAIARDGIYQEVGGKVNEVSRVLGNDRDRMIDFFRRELNYAYDPDAPSVADASAQINSTRQQIQQDQTLLAEREQTLSDLQQEFAPSSLTSGVEAEIKRLKTNIEKRQGEITTQQKQLDKALSNDKNRGVDDLIQTIVDLELGRTTQTALENKIKGGEKLETPKIAETINPAEIRARMALDNIYSMEAGLVAMNNEISQLNKEIGTLARDGTNLVASGRPDMMARGRAKFRKLEKNKTRIRELEDSVDSLAGQLTTNIADFEDIIDNAEEQGIDLGFSEDSVNWEQALRDLEDDTLFWGSGVLGDITGGIF